MNDRLKFQVWSDRLGQWRTAYVLPAKLDTNINCFTLYGFIVRVSRPGGRSQYYYEKTAA